jgi:hypothetical protein
VVWFAFRDLSAVVMVVVMVPLYKKLRCVSSDTSTKVIPVTLNTDTWKYSSSQCHDFALMMRHASILSGISSPINHYLRRDSFP